MAALKRHRGTWILILLLATGFFLLRDKRGGASTNALPLLTINVPTPFSVLDNGPDDSDPTVGVFQFCGDVTIANGGSITCDESGTPASACPIKLVILGNLLIQAGGSIHAENLGGNGGNGGDISITVGGDFTMDGPGPGGVPSGAFISSQNKGGGNGHGGDILIQVGGVKTIPDPVVNPDPNNPSPRIGVCESPVICGVTIPVNTGDALIATGAAIISDSASGRAGDIALYTGRNITVHGTVHAEGFSGAGHGGAITLDACCDLLIGDTGLVRSAGRDPGPDRVHVEACIVTIFGVVESTGPAHEDPEPNCTPPERPGKPANSTACVEIWSGTTILIDSTGTHFGQVNADTGMSGGVSGLGWIDILANGAIVINDGTNNDHVQPIGGGPGVAVLHAVHANQYLPGGHGGIIVVMSKFGSVSTFGNAIQANDVAAGGKGGSVTVQAGGIGSPTGDVLFDSASIQAMGGVGSGSSGGTIAGRSFNGDLSGTGGELNAFGDAGTSPGSVTLEACLGATYSGVSTPPFVLGPFDLICGGSPTFPSPADTLLPLATCAAACQPVTFTPTPTNTPTSTTFTPTPTPTVPCIKEPVRTALAGHVPDVVVRLDLNQSIQAAVTGASDTNGDGFVIVLVVKDGTGQLGGHTNQRVTVSRNDYGHPFQLFGCSVTMHDPNRTDGLPTGWITAGAGGANTIFTMDLHGADSEVAGWKVEGNGRTVRNTGGSGSPVGVWFVGNNNLMHNGSGTGNGVGLKIEGSNNVATDTDVFSNTSHGVQVIGNSNHLLKIDAGDIGKGNGGDGFNVSGNSNVLTENKARSNTHDGIRIFSGTGNTLKKNLSGGTASQNNGDCEFEVVAGNINKGENKANNVLVPGAVNSPFPTGCIGSP
jgi:parallel beta-helix repeat protein